MPLFARKNIFALFWLIAATELSSQLFNIPTLHIILKPILIPILMVCLLAHSGSSALRNLLIAGLFFSFIGDTLLLFEQKHELFFIGGLVSFLITHVFYSWYFIRSADKNPSLLKQRPYLLLPVLLYTAALLFLLIPKLGPLSVPVIIYSLVLTFMLCCSLHAYHSFNPVSRLFTICGTIFFVISDSLLAIDKFYTPFSYAGFFIMATYCLAQYCIVKGFIKNKG
jgi:uncharacterized membrane protein YhhN